MVRRYVETRSGSRVMPPRCWGWPSCYPLWRRYCHERTPSDVRPRRRLHDQSECSGQGPDPAIRLGGGGAKRPGPRPAGRLSRGLRPVGTLAQALGSGLAIFRRRPGHAPAGGPLRARPTDALGRRLLPGGHTQRRPGTLGRLVRDLPLAEPSAAGDPSASPTGYRLARPALDQSGTQARARRAACRRPSRRTALPRRNHQTSLRPRQPQPVPGRPVGHRGDES